MTDNVDPIEIIEQVSSLDEYTFRSVARSSFRKNIRFRNNEIVELGSLQALFEIKTSKNADLPLFTGTTFNDIITFTDIKSFTINIPGSITKEFRFEKAYYHLFLINSKINFTRRLLHGPFLCEQT